jgi:hypothetical protein
MSTAQPTLATDEVIIAEFEIRPDGKNSSAEDTHTLVVEATGDELDLLKHVLHDDGLADWMSSGPMTPAEVRGDYAWAFEHRPEPETETDTAQVKLPEPPKSSKGG